ncbi:MAG: TIGR03087 family PEP-CTERM/XrtA system glycosyltransferase [Gammaproteobacteria bacterium]|nr:TIGR03087 family PEP-CTERM/XrtA system glycosyltransferase [Gammaproteobacteria bacterium]
MHCLYLAQRIPFPPNKGEKLRSFHQINFLRKNGIEVTVAAPFEQSDELEYFKRLEQEYGCLTLSQPLSHKLLRYLSGIAGNTSLSEAHFYSSGLQKQIDELLQQQNIDAIVCTASSMANYVFRSTALAKIARRPRLVMDFMDMDSHKWLQYSCNTKPPMRWVYQREASLVRRLENRVGNQFDACFFVAEPETNLYKEQAGKPAAEVLSIGNGIDPAEFYPAAQPAEVTAPHLLFAGVMDYTPNVDAMLWFYNEVWPSVLTHWPDATLTIAGMNPTPAIARLQGVDNVRVTGFVDDILPYFHECNIFVAPFRIARGIQNKILQAFACGLPVVSTSMGAEGIKCTPGQNIEVGDEPNDMFDAIKRLMADPHHYQYVRNSALATIDEHYSWDGVLAPLLQLLDNDKATPQ